MRIVVLLIATIAIYADAYVNENDSNFFTNGENCCLSYFLSLDAHVIFDVGANVGKWTLMALDYASDAKVYAFEPHPNTFKVLKDNVSDKNVECVPIGLSNCEGVATFWVWNEVNSELNGLFYRPILKKLLEQSPHAIEISVMPLDRFCELNSIPHIDYLKIDTEGNEYFVLLGAENMIAQRQIDIIQFEYGGCYIDSKTSLESIYRYLKANGFAVFKILADRLLPIFDWDAHLENYEYCNYVAVLSK